ncbi:MAG: hypothetical protein ACK4YO_00070 [Candidatus Altarchaeaceae archaeon]
MANKNPKPILSRGIPSKESLFLPKHDGKIINSKGGLNENIIWDVEDVIDFIFPKIYQPRYHEISVKFVEFLLKEGKLNSEKISKFLKDNNFSKATLENIIIPKLVNFGLIKREREQTMKGKGRKLILSDSLVFSHYLERISKAWSMIVLTARQKRKVNEEKEKYEI